jgi:LytS/YehU family sensor histidine kinase
VEVRNDGPSYTGGGASSAGGVGLSNIRARLRRLYGSGYVLELLPDERGTLAVLEVPWRSEREDLP